MQAISAASTAASRASQRARSTQCLADSDAQFAATEAEAKQLLGA